LSQPAGVPRHAEPRGSRPVRIPLHEQTLTDTHRILDDDHPDTLSSAHNLAGAYESAGDFGRAVPLSEQAVTGLRRVLGNEHPTTMTVMANLAALRQRQRS
jgi:Tetratricopeptide repeat